MKAKNGDSFFGCSKDEVLQIFNESLDKVDCNGRLDKHGRTTLEQLAESSKALLDDDEEFIKSIYMQI